MFNLLSNSKLSISVGSLIGFITGLDGISLLVAIIYAFAGGLAAAMAKHLYELMFMKNNSKKNKRTYNKN